MPHTPGPWRRNIKPVKRYPVIFAGRNTHIAAVSNNSGISDAEMEANCDLIAAAPDLLYALQSIKADLTGRDQAFTERVANSLRYCKEAIALATGEKTA